MSEQAVQRARELVARIIAKTGPRLTGTAACREGARMLREAAAAVCDEAHEETFPVHPGAFLGFIKVLVEKPSRKILGAAVLAASGAELVHLYVDLMNAGAPVDVIRNAVHIHPTLAEAVQSAVG
jgi:hypothetical protein